MNFCVVCCITTTVCIRMRRRLLPPVRSPVLVVCPLTTLIIHIRIHVRSYITYICIAGYSRGCRGLIVYYRIMAIHMWVYSRRLDSSLVNFHDHLNACIQFSNTVSYIIPWVCNNSIVYASQLQMKCDGLTLTILPPYTTVAMHWFSTRDNPLYNESYIYTTLSNTESM